MATEKTKVRGIRLSVEEWKKVDALVQQLSLSKDQAALKRRGKEGRYTLGDFVRQAIREKMAHVIRSRRSRK